MKYFAAISLLLSPLCYFVGPYLDGRGLLPRGSGLLSVGVAMFILPFGVSFFVAAMFGRSLLKKAAVAFAALFVQFAIIFIVTPPAARSEMIGIGHRYQATYPIAQLKLGADEILLKHSRGTLATNPVVPPKHLPMGGNTVLVSDLELPPDLRGKFQCIAIVDSYGEVRVVFEVEPNRGIVCGTNQARNGFFYQPLAKDISAYRYQRP